MGKVYVGIDAGSRTCHLVGMDGKGIVLHDVKFDTREISLVDAVKEISGEVHLHIETGELTGWIRSVLKRHVKRIVVGHAKTNAWIAKDPLKKDRVDAEKLADLLRMNRVHEVYYPDDDHRAVFKQVVQHYDDLTADEVRVKCKIKARLRTYGVIVQGSEVFGEEGRWQIVDRIPSIAAKQIVAHLYEVLEHKHQAREKARKLMLNEARRYEEIARFRKVPGVGPVGACRFSAYVQTPHRFSSKRKLWRYCQLGVTDRSSDGKPLGRRRLDRNGNSRLKDMSCTAFMGSMITKKSNAFRRAFQKSLSKTHNRTHARLTTQRKIVATLWAMWKKGEEYMDDKG